MRHKIIGVSQAKARLLELTRKVQEEGQAFLLTKDGEPIGALVPLEEYEALQETSDVMVDSQAMRNLKSALADEQAGRLWKRNKDGRWSKLPRRAKTKSA